VTFVAYSRGVLAFVSSQACNFSTESSCVVAGGATEIFNLVGGPIFAQGAKPLFWSSPIPGPYTELHRIRGRLDVLAS
jgi:hypothetical protein